MKMFIFGAGKQAELTYYYFKNDSPHDIIGFCLEDQYFNPSEAQVLGLPVLKFSELLALPDIGDIRLHIAIGENSYREQAFNLCKSHGLQFVNYISSRATGQLWSDTEFGENVFVDQCCRIHPFVKIGNNTILIGTDIGHHTTIGNNVLISGAVLAGDVTVGDNTFIGLNAIIKEHVVIGKHNIIGAACYIGRNTDDQAVFSSPYAKQRPISADKLRVFKAR